MLTIQDFLNAGYKQYQTIKDCDGLLQKCIYTPDSRVKRYFINLYIYDWSKFREYNKENTITFSAEVSLYDMNDRCFQVTFSVSETDTIENIEGFFGMTYERMFCIPDIYNND